MTLPPTNDPRSGRDEDTTNPLGDAAPAEIVRSEERLQVGTALRPTRRVRLRKRVVTEEVTQTVTIRREELVVEEEELDAAELMEGGDHDFGGHDYEIVLHEERVVTSTRVVPIERVRVSVRTVTEDVAIAEDLRQEQVDLETLPRTEVSSVGND